MLFLPAREGDGSQGFFEKKYYLKGGDFFSKNPEGLTLTD